MFAVVDEMGERKLSGFTETSVPTLLTIAVASKLYSKRSVSFVTVVLPPYLHCPK